MRTIAGCGGREQARRPIADDSGLERARAGESGQERAKAGSVPFLFFFVLSFFLFSTSH